MSPSSETFILVLTSLTESADLFTSDCIQHFADLVEQYNGHEVFAIGECDTNGIIEKLTAVAFGTVGAVPAPAHGARSGHVLVHNHPSGHLDPSDADINIASMYGKSGLGFYIVDNTCSKVRVVVKPYFEAPLQPVADEALLALFGPDGALSRSMVNFEFRPEQLEMMKLVASSYNNDRIAVAEAGTGVGKSFGYLGPSLLWAIANRKRVIVSTNTINLQEQLIGKDLPDLAKKLGLEFKAALVKGRSNYLSIRRLEFAMKGNALFQDDRASELSQLSDWGKSTTDGSRSDLPFDVTDETWESAMSDKDDCLRAQCPRFNECFFYKSRRNAASADIVIANHHLVMADLALKMDTPAQDYMSILPPFDRIVFDEAHNLEDIATRYFAGETSHLAMRRQMNRLIRPRDQGGVIKSLHDALVRAKGANAYSVTPEIVRMLQNFPSLRSEADYAINFAFQELFSLTQIYFHADNMKRNERRELRIKGEVLESDYWEAAAQHLSNIINELSRMIDPVEKLIGIMAEYREDVIKQIFEHLSLVKSIIKKLSDHRETLQFFLRADGIDYCRWFEIGYIRDMAFIRPAVAPLEISDQLRDTLFARKKTIVLTSATLTVNNKFDFLKRQLGLSANDMPRDSTPEDQAAMAAIQQRLDFLQLDTPFDYSQNCLLGIPNDLPEPADPAFHRAIVAPIVEAVTITQGRAFVLFTSYRALTIVLDMCRPGLEAAGITCFRQGEMPRSRLLDTFRACRRGALFATSSFWEGVDVQGKALECLILTKLPFSVPSTPLLEARAEAIERRGGNSFYEMSVPSAVIKFKQGFGRLIRSKSDRGVVLILDRRILTKPYGRIFLNSLPPAARCEGKTEDVIATVTAFMEARAAEVY